MLFVPVFARFFSLHSSVVLLVNSSRLRRSNGIHIFLQLIIGSQQEQGVIAS